MKGSTSAQIVGAMDEVVKLLERNHSQVPRGITFTPNGERLYALWHNDDERLAVRRAFEKIGLPEETLAEAGGSIWTPSGGFNVVDEVITVAEAISNAIKFLRATGSDQDEVLDGLVKAEQRLMWVIGAIVEIS